MIYSSFSVAFFTLIIGGLVRGTKVPFTLPINVTSTSYTFGILPPATASAWTQFTLDFLTLTDADKAGLVTSVETVTDKYNIDGTLSLPSTASDTVLLFVHGLGFDKQYWDLPFDGYSFVDDALKKGYATLTYSRLGTGSSSAPEGFTILQSDLDIKILHSVAQTLRSGIAGKPGFKKVVAIGHSYGSIQIASVAKAFPSDFDSIVLTGFSLESAGQNLALPAFARQKDVDPSAKKASDSYLSFRPGQDFQWAFSSDDYDKNVLAWVQKNIRPYTLGELLTLANGVGPTTYTGPVFAISGQRDLIFCSSNCTGKLDPIKGLFQSAKSFNATIVPGAGHALAIQRSAAATAASILEWVATA